VWTAAYCNRADCCCQGSKLVSISIAASAMFVAASAALRTTRRRQLSSSECSAARGFLPLGAGCRWGQLRCHERIAWCHFFLLAGVALISMKIMNWATANTAGASQRRRAAGSGWLPGAVAGLAVRPVRMEAGQAGLAIVAAARDQLDTGQRGVPDHTDSSARAWCNLPSPSCHLLFSPIARAGLAAWVLAVSRAEQASTLARRLSRARAVRVASQG
jgi:hypothetical protein